MEFYNDIMNEPKWYRWADGLVVLLIGVAVGITVAMVLPAMEVETRVTNTQTTRLRSPEAPTQDKILTENGTTIRVDEI